MALPTVTLDPTVPQGSETLKLGDDRIRALATGILRCFGFDGTTQETFVEPISSVDPTTGLATVQGDPVQPLGIATAQYAGRRAVFASVTSSPGQVLYNGSTTPTTATPYDQGAIYVIFNNDAPGTGNAAGAQLQLNTGGYAALDRGDGSAIKAGDFQGGTVYLITYDGTNFRMSGFAGGSVPFPVQLPANPTEDLQAAPKQYVDTAVGHPVITAISDIGGGALVPANAQDVATYSVTTPNDGNNYIVECDYWVYISLQSGTIVDVVTWVDVNGTKVAGGATRVATADATQQTSGIGSSAMCQTVYAPNTALTIKVRGQTLGGNADVHALGFNGLAPDGPSAYLTVTMFRVS